MPKPIMLFLVSPMRRVGLSRKTVRRRFLELPKILAFTIPHIAIESLKYSYDIFHFRFAFVDKSVFRSLGGIWHKKHMTAKIVPHSSVVDNI